MAGGAVAGGGGGGGDGDLLGNRPLQASGVVGAGDHLDVPTTAQHIGDRARRQHDGLIAEARPGRAERFPRGGSAKDRRLEVVGNGDHAYFLCRFRAGSVMVATGSTVKPEAISRGVTTFTSGTKRDTNSKRGRRRSDGATTTRGMPSVV